MTDGWVDFCDTVSKLQFLQYVSDGGTAVSQQAINLMGLCKKDVSPVRQQWSYIFLSLTHRIGVHNPAK